MSTDDSARVATPDIKTVVAERYGVDGGRETPLCSWSMAKSLTHALAGVLVREGRLDVHAPAPVPQWQGDDDPRRAITTEHLLRMCDGLEFAEDYVEHFLVGAPIPGATDERDLLTRMLDEMTPSQVDTTFRATVGATEPLVIVVAPEDAAATLPTEVLSERLAEADAAALIKVGRHFAKVRDVLESLGLGDRARYIQHATMDNQTVLPLDAVSPETVPYFSMILVHRRGEAWR